MRPCYTHGVEICGLSDILNFMKVYTLGYQHLSLSEYIDVLRASGVGVILDVREIAWSRKPGFSKSQLKASLSDAGINYIHVPSAGNPSSIRKTAKSSKECLKAYQEHLRTNDHCIDELLSHIQLALENGRPACLTCFERLPTECHRSILIEALIGVQLHLDSIHLPIELLE